MENKITTANYFARIKELNTSQFPDVLKESYNYTKDVTEGHKNWKFYKDDEAIQGVVDDYLTELNNYIAKKESNPKITPHQAEEAAKDLIRSYVKRGDSYEYLKSTRLGYGGGTFSATITGDHKIHVTKIKDQETDYKFSLKEIYDMVKSEGGVQKPAVKESGGRWASRRYIKTAKPESAGSSTSGNIRVSNKEGHPVERIAEEVKFIKRYLLLHNKSKTKDQILNFINSLQRAIVERRIRKTSTYAKEVMQVQTELLRVHKTMKPINNKPFNLSAETIERFSAIAGSERIRFSTQYLKRYIGIQGKNITKEKAKSLYDIVTKAVEAGNIKSSDPYFGQVKKALASLKQFIKIARKGETVDVHEEVLNGLNGVLGCACEEQELNGFADTPIRPIRKPSGVMSVDEARNKEYHPVEISGKWLKLIGKFCLPTQFFVHGLGGSGKTSFVLLFTQYLASLGYKILYVAGEQYNTPTFTELLNRLNIQGGDNFQIVEALNVLNPSNFDFVVLDSKDYLELEVPQFLTLLDKFPKQSFIVLSQSIKSGNFTGSERWRNTVDVMIHADRGLIRTGHDKNRWGGSGEIQIFEQEYRQAA